MLLQKPIINAQLPQYPKMKQAQLSATSFKELLMLPNHMPWLRHAKQGGRALPVSAQSQTPRRRCTRASRDAR